VSATPTSLDPDAPRLDLCAESTHLRVGESVTVVGVLTNLGLPQFAISARSCGAADFVPIAVVAGDDVRVVGSAGPVLSLVEARADFAGLTLVLRATAAGCAEVAIGATGEASEVDAEGRRAYFWTSVGAPILRLTVEAAATPEA
jgi:hypothetical protein